jgi:aquaglyceroporin related protein, other eukaryote
MNLAWGWGAMIGIYVAGGISGAHLNPAISVVLALYRGFPWRLLWRYLLAQIVAGFIAALIVYGVYSESISTASGSPSSSTAGFDFGIKGMNKFYTSINPSVSISTAFSTQLLASAIFVLCVLAMGDDHNAPPGAGMNAFIIGILVFVTCTAFPYNTGTSLSPARDFGPRLVVLIIWGKGEVWTERE